MSPQAQKPIIHSFNASLTTVSKGQHVTLSWDVAGSSYFVVTPQVGAVRGTFVIRLLRPPQRPTP